MLKLSHVTAVWLICYLLVTVDSFHLKMSCLVDAAAAADSTVAMELMVSSHLQTISSLSAEKQRAVYSIIGAAVADAACRPLHWVYDRDLMASTIGNDDPEFWPISVSPFYTLPTGSRSCYNDLGLTMLKALCANNCVYDRSKFVAAMSETFSATSTYRQALNRRKIAYDPAR